jgi:glucokinase
MSKIVFGVDIGGTTVKMGVFTAEGTLLENWEIPTRKEEGGKYILVDVADSIHAKIDQLGYTKEDVVGVGVGAPGPVDANGVINKAVNLGWSRMSIVDTLSPLVQLPVKAANDANVASLGEMWKGGGRGVANMVAVTLGTGVGGGVIVEGKLVAGSVGAGGEIGHIHVEDDETDVCGCGNTGCLEQYGSATGVVRLAKRRLAKDDAPSMLREGEISAKAVWDAVKAGDTVAMEVAEKFGYYLGKGLAMIAAIVNPEVFVIGGGVSKAGDILFEYIRPYFDKYAFPGCKNARLVLAELGNDAGIYGAAKLVIEE